LNLVISEVVDSLFWKRGRNAEELECCRSETLCLKIRVVGIEFLLLCLLAVVWTLEHCLSSDGSLLIYSEHWQKSCTLCNLVIESKSVLKLNSSISSRVQFVWIILDPAWNIKKPNYSTFQHFPTPSRTIFDSFSACFHWHFSSLILHQRNSLQTHTTV